MNKRRAAIGLVLAIGVSGVAWAFWPKGPDPQMVKVQQLQEQAFNRDSKATFEERRKVFEELRQEAEKLTPDQRAELMRTNPPPFMKEMQKMVGEFATLPPEKRRELLDKQIDRMESMRKQMQKRAASGGGPGGGPPGGGPGGWGGGGPGGGGGGGRGGFANMDPARRQQFQKQMLNNTTPEDRAAWGNYMREMAERRQQRGMPPMRGPF